MIAGDGSEPRTGLRGPRAVWQVRRRAPSPVVLAIGLWLVVSGSASSERPWPPFDPDGVARSAAALPQLRSLLVSWRGDLVAEHYARGVRADRLANVKSVSKSVLALLVGIAIDRGLVEAVDAPIATFLPALARAPDRRKQAITVEHLLTMRSGLESTSGANYGRWVRSRNWVQHVLDRPLVSDPGSSMEYSTGSSHLLSALLTKAAGRSTWEFARDVLGRPLGIDIARWPRDPQGIYFGGNEMLFTPRQLVAIGQLWLRRGEHAGRQIVPAAWVETSCTPRTASRWDPDRRYGYGWWVQDIRGHRACFAWGYGGQYVLVFDALDLVVVATSSPTISEDRRDHRRRLLALVADAIVSPIADASAPGDR